MICLDKMKGKQMKKLMAILIALQSIAANAYEYSSENNDDHRHYERGREEWIENDSGRNQPRYQQGYQQPPIQIYLVPNQNSYSRDELHHRHSGEGKYREERYWRERREELQQQPQSLNYGNQFYRDENHW